MRLEGAEDIEDIKGTAAMPTKEFITGLNDGSIRFVEERISI